MFDRLDVDSRKLMDDARAETARHGHDYLGPEVDLNALTQPASTEARWRGARRLARLAGGLYLISAMSVALLAPAFSYDQGWQFGDAATTAHWLRAALWAGILCGILLGLVLAGSRLALFWRPVGRGRSLWLVVGAAAAAVGGVSALPRLADGVAQVLRQWTLIDDFGLEIVASATPMLAMLIGGLAAATHHGTYAAMASGRA